jgi:Abortive infection alpha
MSDTGSLIPISDEQAKAVQEALKALQGVGGFLREVLGTVPEDLVGYFGGDWLKIRRAENAARMIEKAKARLEARNVKPERPSISVALPLLIAAADEDRDELQEIWARLLAAAMDPARSKAFRGAFIEIVKKMDPLDAVALQYMRDNSRPAMPNNLAERISNQFKVSFDEATVCLLHLHQLGLATDPDRDPFPSLTAMGRLLARTVAD